MARPSARQAQFEVMVSFMERHGDIMLNTGKDCYTRIDNIKKWHELTNLLNNKLLGESRNVHRWKKCWSDFKNNTKKKLRKLKKNEVRVGLSNLEKRVLKLIGDKGPKETAAESDDENVFMIIKDELDAEQPEQCETTLSPPESSRLFFPETYAEVDPEQPDECERTSSQPEQPPHFFREADVEATRQRKSSTSSSSMSSHTEPPPAKRKKRFKDNIKDMTETYLEFERERARMAHEREMARIKQNDQLVTIFGRIVNVLETLAPSVQRYLDRGSSDDR